MVTDTGGGGCALRQIQGPFGDACQPGICVYCGGIPDTRDHVPSKVLLDEPFPDQLPSVPSCRSCNDSFSKDEQYLACFLECVICGTTDPQKLQRQKIMDTFAERPNLRQEIEEEREGDLNWRPDTDRLLNVVMKLARGHAAFELYPTVGRPAEIAFTALCLLTDRERSSFENACSSEPRLLPEVGSRSLFRRVEGNPDSRGYGDDWIVVQPNRYRYSVVQSPGLLVRMVLSEYLACAVRWS